MTAAATTTKVRCFVAVVPPRSALAPLHDVVTTGRARWPELTWVPADRWHVTLAFLGDVDIARLPRLTNALASVPPTPVPRLSLRGGGCFPNVRRPRVFWAGFDGDTEALARLARRVATAARRVTPVDADRGFRAHITVARARTPFHDGAAIVGMLETVAAPAFDADEVVLMRSHLGPTPRYEPLAAWSLAAGR